MDKLSGFAGRNAETQVNMTLWYIICEVGDYMKPLKNKVSITLDDDVIKKIKQLAENDDRSFSQYINMVLKEHLIKIDGTAEK